MVVSLNVRIPITIEMVGMSNFIKKFVGISSNTSSSKIILYIIFLKYFNFKK